MDKITNQVVTDYLSTQLRNKLKRDGVIARRSKSIVSISVLSRYKHKIVNATLTHKRTGEVIQLPDIKLRTTGLWSRVGWFTLPDDKQSCKRSVKLPHRMFGAVFQEKGIQVQ